MRIIFACDLSPLPTLYTFLVPIFHDLSSSGSLIHMQVPTTVCLLYHARQDTRF